MLPGFATCTEFASFARLQFIVNSSLVLRKYPCSHLSGVQTLTVSYLRRLGLRSPRPPCRSEALWGGPHPEFRLWASSCGGPWEQAFQSPFSRGSSRCGSSGCRDPQGPVPGDQASRWPPSWPAATWALPLSGDSRGRPPQTSSWEGAEGWLPEVQFIPGICRDARVSPPCPQPRPRPLRPPCRPFNSVGFLPGPLSFWSRRACVSGGKRQCVLRLQLHFKGTLLAGYEFAFARVGKQEMLWLPPPPRPPN